MTTELQILLWAIVLGLVQVVATGQFTLAQHGMKYAAGPRDEPKPATGVAGRMNRAFSNYMQTFPFFAAAVLIAQVAGIHSGLTVTGAWLYIIGRILFLPLYLLGIPMVRTLAFVVSLVGIVLILIAL